MKSEYNMYMAIQGVEMKGHHDYLERINKRNFTMEEAVLDWHTSGKDIEFREVYFKHKKTLDAYCDKTCGDFSDCKGFGHCRFDVTKLHNMLYDRKV